MSNDKPGRTWHFPVERTLYVKDSQSSPTPKGSSKLTQPGLHTQRDGKGLDTPKLTEDS